MSIRITADSPADLTAELCEKYSVETIPLHIILGNESFDDGITITPDDIYKHYQEKSELPKTAAVSIAEYTDLFEKMTENGDAVIHFNISSQISSTHSNAVIAAEGFENVYVVDSKSLTTGIAFLIIKASEMIEKGMPAKEIAEECRRLTSKVKTTFIISNLEFLHKGGRCSSLSLLGANILSIKPSIKADEDGKLVMDKKYRGKFDKCIESYINDLLNEYSDSIDTDTAIFVRTEGVSDELFNSAIAQVSERVSFKNIITNIAGCTITSHCGKGTFTFMFMTK